MWTTDFYRPVPTRLNRASVVSLQPFESPNRSIGRAIAPVPAAPFSQHLTSPPASQATSRAGDGVSAHGDGIMLRSQRRSHADFVRALLSTHLTWFMLNAQHLLGRPSNDGTSSRPPPHVGHVGACVPGGHSAPRVIGNVPPVAVATMNYDVRWPRGASFSRLLSMAQNCK